MEEMRNAQVLVGKPMGNRLLGKHGSKWKDNTEIMVRRCGMKVSI
jgi:hypothetical protein